MASFNPESIITKSGIYHCCFTKGGERIDTAIIKAGLAFYAAKAEYENVPKKHISAIVARNIEEDGWVFTSSVVFLTACEAIDFAYL
jgi:hypothetical protein